MKIPFFCHQRANFLLLLLPLLIHRRPVQTLILFPTPPTNSTTLCSGDTARIRLLEVVQYTEAKCNGFSCMLRAIYSDLRDQIPNFALEERKGVVQANPDGRP